MIFQGSGAGLHLIDHPTAFAVVDAACGLDEGGTGGGGSDEPGIHCNAVAAHAAAGLENIHPGVVGQANQITHVDVKVIAHQRELVSEGNVHIAKLFSVSLTNSAVRAVVASARLRRSWRRRLASTVAAG